MRLVQWFDSGRKERHAGVLLEENGVETAVSLTSVYPRLRSTLDVLDWMRTRRNRAVDTSKFSRHRLPSAARLVWSELLNTPYGGPRPYLLPAVDVHSNPYAFSLWGAGVTHLRSAQAREKEAKAVRGKPATYYDLIYQAGVRGGKPRNIPGSRPEIFFKSDGYYTVGPNQSLMVAPTAKRCVPEPEIVSFYRSTGPGDGTYIYGEAQPGLLSTLFSDRPFVRSSVRPKFSPPKMRGKYTQLIERIGYTLGNDFSDQGWESENPLYLPHAKVQMGLASIGPVFVTADDPLFDHREIAIRCRVFRGGKVVQDSGALRTGEKHMSHSLENLEFHLFDNRPLRPGEVRGLFWGTNAVFRCPVLPSDRIDIEASSGLGVLKNPVGSPHPKIL